jgi:hypothetical protein
MKVRILCTVLVLAISFACSKDKYTTRPQLKIKSVNDKFIEPGEILRIILEFTDAEGDVSDSAFIQKVTANCILSDYIDKKLIPDFPIKKDLKGEFLITYGYNIPDLPPLGQPQCNRNDTCVFRIWVKDNAGNVSDTVQTETIVIKKI